MGGGAIQLMKNDTLPAVPTGPIPVAVIAGLAEAEAAGTILDVGGPARIHEVSAMLGNAPSGSSGFSIVADVEIYDGVTDLPGGQYAMGPMVFSLSGDLAQNAQMFSHAINTVALTPGGVQTTQPRVAIVFRVLINTNGSCPTGYTTNLSTDNAGCSAAFHGKNLMHIKNPLQGCAAAGATLWVDPLRYLGLGVPLCPLFYSGNWIIRACVEPDIQTRWTGNATPGGFVSLEFKDPNNPNTPYFAMVSGGIDQGFDVTSIFPGWLPVQLNLDFWWTCFLNSSECGAWLLNGTGLLNANGDAFGAISIPNDPNAIGITWYVSFFTYNPDIFNWQSVSPPSLPIVIQ